MTGQVTPEEAAPPDGDIATRRLVAGFQIDRDDLRFFVARLRLLDIPANLVAVFTAVDLVLNDEESPRCGETAPQAPNIRCSAQTHRISSVTPGLYRRTGPARSRREIGVAEAHAEPGLLVVLPGGGNPPPVAAGEGAGEVAVHSGHIVLAGSDLGSRLSLRSAPPRCR